MMFEKLKGVEESELVEVRKDFQKIMVKESFPRNHVLHTEGLICNHLYVIEKGIARSFYH